MRPIGCSGSSSELVPQLGPSQSHTDVVRVSRHIRGGAGFGGYPSVVVPAMGGAHQQSDTYNQAIKKME